MNEELEKIRAFHDDWKESLKETEYSILEEKIKNTLEEL